MHSCIKIRPGCYRHYKGKFYQVIGTARHSETLEELVVYKALYRCAVSKLWVRPLKMFTERIWSEGRRVPRFQYIGKTKQDLK